MAQDKNLPGYPQSIGAKIQVIADHYGPSSYNVTTGDIYTAIGNQNQSGFDKVSAGASLSGVYSVTSRYPAGTGVGVGTTSVVFFWSFGTTGSVTVAQNAAGTGMTTGTVVPIVFSGGGGTGAAGTVTVLSATTISIAITNPGSGYTSAPTAVISATGGTPATLTVTLTTAGQAVTAGTNLSAEVVRIEAIMY